MIEIPNTGGKVVKLLKCCSQILASKTILSNFAGDTRAYRNLKINFNANYYLCALANGYLI
jgi:hypothetical protein